MPIVSVRTGIHAFLGTAAVLACSNALADNNEAIVHNIHETDSYECDDVLGNPGDMTYSNDTAQNWVDEIDDYGTFDYNRRYDEDDYISTEDLIDVDRQTGGTDHYAYYGIDTYDVALLIAQGACRCSNPNCLSLNYGESQTAEMGYQRTDLSVSWDNCTASTRYEMRLGDGDLELFYTLACHSMQKCVWNNGGIAPVDGTNLRLYGGFHGLHSAYFTLPGHMTDFVQDSQYSGVGSHWLDEMHYRQGLGAWNCPVVQIWGDDSTVTTTYYNYAGFEEGTSDRHRDVGVHDTQVRYYIDECDPAGGGEL